jgi:hypothetical protein
LGPVTSLWVRFFLIGDRWVTCVAVSPDGMTAAAGGEDRRTVVWDVDP